VGKAVGIEMGQVGGLGHKAFSSNPSMGKNLRNLFITPEHARQAVQGRQAKDFSGKLLVLYFKRDPKISFKSLGSAAKPAPRMPQC
jgi:hypothetical protein